MLRMRSIVLKQRRDAGSSGSEGDILCTHGPVAAERNAIAAPASSRATKGHTRKEIRMRRIDPGGRMSQTVVHNRTVYVSGQVADDPSGSIEDQTRAVLAK